MNRRPLGFLPYLFIVFIGVRSSFAAAGTEGAAFLNIPVGAGPAALGSAYSAWAADAYAPLYNPGGLGFLDSTQISGQHVSYLESIHYEELSFVHPLQPGRSFGFSAQYLGSGDIPGTDKAGNSIGDFSTHFAAYALAYGQKLGEKLSLGLTAKVIEAKISDVSAHAFAADAGALYKASSKVALAAVVTNMGNKLTFLNDGGSLPLAFKAGAAFAPTARWKLSAETIYRQTGLASGHFGLEWRPIAMLAIRTGYRTDTVKELGALAGFSTGVGLSLWGQEFAYAWVPYGDLGTTQYFSMLLRFGSAAEAKRNLIQYQTIKTHRMAQGRDADGFDDADSLQLMQLLSGQDNEFMARSPSENEVSR